MRRSQHDLFRALAEQMQFLSTSSRLYDRGERWEAKRLAMTLRILLHEGNGQSLFRLLGIKERVSYLSVVDMATPEALAGLLKLDPRVEIINGQPAALFDFAPNYDIPTHKYSFEQWWKGAAMTSGGEPVSRWELVRAAANQDGGGHVDPNLRGVYEKLSRAASSSFMMIGGGGTPMYTSENAAQAAIRTIAWEVAHVLESIEEYLPELNEIQSDADLTIIDPARTLDENWKGGPTAG